MPYLAVQKLALQSIAIDLDDPKTFALLVRWPCMVSFQSVLQTPLASENQSLRLCFPLGALILRTGARFRFPFLVLPRLLWPNRKSHAFSGPKQTTQPLGKLPQSAFDPDRVIDWFV